MDNKNYEKGKLKDTCLDIERKHFNLYRNKNISLCKKVVSRHGYATQKSAWHDVPNEILEI